MARLPECLVYIIKIWCKQWQGSALLPSLFCGGIQAFAGGVQYQGNALSNRRIALEGAYYSKHRYRIPVSDVAPSALPSRADSYINTSSKLRQ